MTFRPDEDPSSFGRDLGATFGDVRSIAAGFSSELTAATREMRVMDMEAQRLSRSLGSSLRSAFDRAVFGGAKLGDVLRGLGSSFVDRTLDAALRPIQSAVGSGLAGLTGTLTGAIGGLFGFKNGGAFSAGRVRAFASGGVIDGPTFFPMRGATGLMGEAGPEAIMPLRRGPDGRLGVATDGGRGGAPRITVNIATPDVQSFRQSRGQVTAELARAVHRGTRRL